MSSCGSSNCSCGSDCKCGNGCGCSMFLDITEMTTTSQILIAGLAPAKGFYKGSGMGVGAENDGCKCGSSCSCDNCSCK